MTPDQSETWASLAHRLVAQRRWPEACQTFQSAWAHTGDDCPVVDKLTLLKNWVAALMQLYRYSDAESALRMALALQPDEIECLVLMGNVLKALGRYDEARGYCLRVTESHPELGEGWCNLGTLAQTAGDYAEAIDCYRKALALTPHYLEIWANLAVILTYSPQHQPLEVLTALRGFDERIARRLRDPRPHLHDRNPDRRLRVGYVSPDFRKHAVAFFALPLIEGHRKEQVEIFCYYNHREEDDRTQAFRAAAEHWINCVDMSDEELAERIRQDRIDILVDLTGYTENNRLLVFARKPAPVQVTWMGYVATTGLTAMDWRVTHADADPEGSEAYYSEKLWRLPGTMWCYRPLPGSPEVSPPPCERKGHITFGSFNRYSKNSPLVLDTWAAILGQVPDSRLLICVPEGSIRQQMVRFFTERGINQDRITTFAKVSHEDFRKLHAEVDIALDPFPFGGGTTTCETLWMGVPLVTVTGRAQAKTDDLGTFPARFASRMGQAFLTNIGLPELVAETLPQYISIAVQLAKDVPRLMQLRQSLRPRMAAAPLTDEARFVREMEEAYRAMWRAWCESELPKSGNIGMKTFLHVGCGPKHKGQTTRGFNTPDWTELRLDIDKNVNPDIVGTMLDMSAVADASVDAVFSSYNIEHLYPHEVPLVLKEFLRVLKPDGFLVITCPDLQSVCALIAEDKLTEPAYDSPAGPITPIDILYGHRPALAKGNLFMAHRCGFTEKVLIGTLRGFGFVTVASKRRGHPYYDLYAIATKSPAAESDIRALAALHMPG